MSDYGDDYENNDYEGDNYDYDDDRDYDGGDDKQYQSEVGAFDRVGYGNFLDTKIGDGKKDHMSQTPLERFVSQVDAISRNITEQRIHDIGQSSIDYMIKIAELLPFVEYKNPLAYVLGYIASKGGRDIDSKLVQESFIILKKLSIESVQNPDVIRYARLWKNLINV